MILTDEQRRKRRTMIGSSDIAAIVGVSPYHAHDPQAVWNDKMGLVDDDFDADKADAFWFGHQVEPIIAKRYEEKAGVRLVPGGTFTSTKTPWAGATIDFQILGEKRIVECKLVGSMMAFGWDTSRDDGLPHDKICQVQWQMMVREAVSADVAALLGGTDFRIFRVLADPPLQSDLLMHAERFWREHIETKTPPDITGSDSVRAYLQAKYPVNNRTMLEPDEATDRLALERIDAFVHEKAAATRKKELDHRIMSALGENEGFKSPTHGWKFTWKTNKNGVRVTRFTPPKGMGAEDE